MSAPDLTPGPVLGGAVREEADVVREEQAHSDPTPHRDIVLAVFFLDVVLRLRVLPHLRSMRNTEASNDLRNLLQQTFC